MAKNNHSEIESSDSSSKQRLDRILKEQDSHSDDMLLKEAMSYAAAVSRIENAIAVVSDLSKRISHIIAGDFAKSIGLNGYRYEQSIWENKILSLMTPEEQEEKFISELRFLHFMRGIPKCKRHHYYLATRLRLRYPDGNIRDVLHKMHYVYDNDDDKIKYAICLYSPFTFAFPGKSVAVNSVTGVIEELSTAKDNNILSRREIQILSMIDAGMKSKDISTDLNISIHTVNRHRQEILGKLQVKNSHEACRIAQTMGLLS